MQGQRWVVAATTAAVASAAHAQPPPPVPVVLKNAPLREIAQRIGAASGCPVMAMATGTFDVAFDKLYLWDEFAEIEGADHISARSAGASFMLASGPATNEPGWRDGWQRHGPWAIAYMPGRLLVLGLEDYVVDRVELGSALAGKAPLVITTTLPGLPGRACAQTAIRLAFASPQADRGSFAGKVVVKTPNTVARRVQVPAGDDIVDVSEGRVRIHVGTRTHSPTERDIHVGWDTMGEPGSIGVELVDERGAPLKTTSSGSSRGTSGRGSQGSEDRTVAWTGAASFVVLHVPHGGAAEVAIPFRFDNVALTTSP